ncbi:MAG: DUF11 domain-containing protein, partial [Candidatus Omnitrophica bacterium]|nr:DUF11 domain-containing protein [Candidatus Omnitrophota bacterium]
VYIYLDNNADGLLDAPGDTLIGQSAAWAGDENTVTFAAPETITAGTSKYFIAVYDFDGSAGVGDTFRCSITDNTKVSAQGVVSSINIPANGPYPVEGGLRTVSDRGSLSFSLGENNPSDGNVVDDQTDVEMLQFQVGADSVEDVTVSSITFSHTGTGTPSDDVATVRLYRDNNGDGNLDAGDDLISQENVWNSPTITLLPGEVVSADTSESWLVVYDYNGNASEAETFISSIDVDSDISASGQWSGLPVTSSGSFPLEGGQKMIVPERGHLRVELGPNNPAAESLINNQSKVEVLQLALTEYTGYETVRVNYITIDGSGTGHEVEDIDKVDLYRDYNGDGIINGSDYGITASAVFDADDGQVTLSPGFRGDIAPGETQYWLVVYTFNTNPSKGETFTASFTDGANIAAKGRTTGITMEAEGTFPLDGETFTIVTGEVVVEEGLFNPGDHGVSNKAQDELVMQIRMTETTGYEDVKVESLVITDTGTADPYWDVDKVDFYLDSGDTPGVVDAGDTHLGSEYFDETGKCELMIVPVIKLIPAGGERNILVLYSLNGSAEINETFSPEISADSDVSLKGYSSKEAITPSGTFPVEGCTLTMASDPSGRVYNALYDRDDPNGFIQGAIVEVYDAGPDGLKNTADDGGLVATNAPGGTPANGTYAFMLGAGNYWIEVTPPSGYTFPSDIIAQGSLPGNSTVVGSHEEVFVQGVAEETVDLPLDPEDTTVFKLDKEANKDEVVVGDIVTYVLTIENNYGDDVDIPLYVRDRLPAGFKYIEGTTLLDGKKIDDPRGKGIRTFSVGTFTAGESKKLSYQLVAGSGVEPGNTYTNKAVVVADSGYPLSNIATEEVKVVYDPIFDLSIIIGKVFNDKNGDGIQQRGEEGIADVKIATEDGLYVITDKDGKYHIEGLLPQTKLLKVDTSTLPQGAEFTTENPRVVRLTRGLLAKVNFGVKVSEKDYTLTSDEGAPYLEVKVITEPTKIEPELTVYHTPDVPQLDLEGNSLDTPVVFRINTNYSDFISTWKLEIFSSGNRVSPVKVFEGTQKDLFKQISWDGIDNEGNLIEPEETYIYVLTVKDSEGNKDETIENKLYVSYKRTISREEKVDVISEELYTNKLAQQTIPVETKGVSVNITGTTDKRSYIYVDGQNLGIAENGEFKKNLILPETKKSIKVEAVKEGKKSVYTKKLNLDKDYFFLVALGDAVIGKMSASGNIAPVRDKDKYQSGYYFDGRFAYYLKAKVKGKYLITASYDSARERGGFERFIDPDKYYPVYGDSSSVVDDTNTRGKFYLLIEWDKSYLTWGNYETDIKDVDLAAYNRTLYGGKLHYQSVSTTKYGDPDTVFIVFSAETDKLPAHNEFLSTGGSLYYLKHTDVVEGSDMVKIEVRDKDTGIVKNSYTAEEGVDYEIDYDQGRIIFSKPVDMIASSEELIQSGVSLGDLVYVVVDYEYEPDEFLDEGTYGARVTQQLTDNIKVGTTYIKDEKEGG